MLQEYRQDELKKYKLIATMGWAAAGMSFLISLVIGLKSMHFNPSIELHMFSCDRPLIAFKDDYLDKKVYQKECADIVKTLLTVSYVNIADYWEPVWKYVHPEAHSTIKREWEKIMNSYTELKKNTVFHPQSVKANVKGMSAEVTGLYSEFIGESVKTTVKTFVVKHKHCGHKKYMLLGFEEKKNV